MSHAEQPTTPTTRGGRPSPRVRLAVALTAGLAAGLFSAWCVGANAGTHPADFEFWWRGTRAWLAGADPYLLRPHTPVWPLIERLFYPGPALLLTVPFAWLRVGVAAGLFVGGSTAWLAWLLTRDAYWRLLLFVSPMFLAAAKLGQWSPVMMVATFVPSLGLLLAAKPTLGLAYFAYRPTWRAVVSGVAIVALSLVLFPAWPREWLDNVHAVVTHPAPIQAPGGALLLLALLRWRTPEGRLLVAMACVPQLLLFADQVPLGLIARTRTEALVMSLCSVVAFETWLLLASQHADYVVRAAPYVMTGCYLPALVIVLLRPNAAESPVRATVRPPSPATPSGVYEC